MPDINLIEDTKTPNGDSSTAKKAPSAPLQYSNVEDAKKGDHPLMKPSGPSLWLKSLFSRNSEGKKVSTPKPTSPKIGEVKKDPDDIFADFDAPGTVLMARRPAAEPRVPTQPASRIVQTPAGSSIGAAPVQRAAPVPVPQPQPAIEGAPLKTPVVPPFAARRANIPPAPTLRPAPAAPPHDAGNKAPRDAAKKKPKRSDADAGELGGVNLLTEEFDEAFNPRKKLTTLGLVAAAAALLVGIVDVSLLLWKETQVKKTNDKTAEVNQMIATIKELEPDQRLAIAYRAQNDVLRQLLNRHVYWTQFLNRFQQYTLPDVFYPSGISLDLGGSVSMTGVAPDLETVLSQFAIYQNAPDLVQSAAVNTITRDSGGERYSFVIDLVFNPTVFYRPIGAPPTTTP